MVSNCKDYYEKGYCIRGQECPHEHGSDLIELNISDYEGLIEARHIASIKAAVITKEQKSELTRKKADLLNSLVSQQQALIKKIELCSDETEKVRLKKALDEMSQKTKFWLKQEGTKQESS